MGQSGCAAKDRDDSRGGHRGAHEWIVLDGCAGGDQSAVFDYDQIIIVGPVFPHEVVGFSGGSKYLFPGVSGPEVLNFFHWLGAVVTNPMIIGNKWTPVRKVVDRVGGMVNVPKLCLCMVVEKAQLAGLFIGTPESAWDQASELSKKLHITYKDHP